MRQMPRIVHSGLDDGEGFELPAIPRDDFDRRLVSMIEGPLSDTERKFVERAVRHNWNLKIIADELRRQRGLEVQS